MRAAWTTALCLCCIIELHAAGLRGTVVDPSGRCISDARIELRSGDQTAGATLTGDSGAFDLDGISPGTYTLSVQAAGFVTRQTKISVAADEPESLEIILADVAPVYTSVTVTASRGAVEDLQTIAQLVTSRTREEIRSRPLPTVVHVLDGSPGIEMQETTAGQASPILRGLTGYQTLGLVDGIRLNTSLFRSGPNQYFTFIEPNEVDRVEVVLGPSGPTYGSDSMGGTINFVTAPPSFSTGTRHEWRGQLTTFGTSADLSAGWDGQLSGGTRRFAYTLGGATQHHNDLRTGGGTDSHDAFRRYFGLPGDQVKDLIGDRLPSTAAREASAHVKLGYHITPSQLLLGWYEHTSISGMRSYRDLLGGSANLQSLVTPQGLNFGYLRYEKQGIGPLDTLSGTFSVNSQQDGSAKQAMRVTDPITNDESRVDVLGYSVQATTHMRKRQALVFGGDIYDERVFAQRFSVDPVSRAAAQQRAQYPNGARYTTSSLFLQDVFEALPNRLRLTGGIRATRVGFSARAANNLDRGGKPLGVVDSDRHFSDVTFNSAASVHLTRILGWHVIVGRGFRAPNLNDLGSIGVTTLGYDVPSEELLGLQPFYALDSSDTSGSSGHHVGKLGAESLYNYETGVTVNTARFYARAQLFDAELLNPISGRTLLFPANAVPAAVAGVAVTPITPSAVQAQQGLVAVASSLSPRALKTDVNDGHTKYYGTELVVRAVVAPEWTIETNYSFLAGRDLNPNRPVRRLPPQQGKVSVRYVPSSRRLWLEVAARMAGAQWKLNGGDIDDDRIGGSRRRQDIASFFNGGFVAPYLTPNKVFAPTGETLVQIQNRVLPVGSTINGVTVANDGTRVPLYLDNPGWLAVDIRGGAPIRERLSLMFAATNLLDRNYRVYGSGVDAPGRNLYVGFKYVF